MNAWETNDINSPQLDPLKTAKLMSAQKIQYKVCRSLLVKQAGIEITQRKSND